MSDSNTLTVRGSRVIPQLNEMTLVEGWNLMSYLRKDPARCALSMESIVDELIIIKDENGAVYMPEFSFNSVQTLIRDSYQVKTFNQVVHLCTK